MNPILERVTTTENKIAEAIPRETQQKYVEKYLEVINSKLDECAEYASTLYGDSFSFVYQCNSAKLSLEGANPQTLYGLYNALRDITYNLPVECDNIFMDTAKAVYGKHQLFKYTESADMYSDTYNQIAAIGIDSIDSTDSTTGL